MIYAKSLQSCPTLCDPRDSSPPGSPIPGILQARTLEWVAISFSNAWKWKVKVKSLSRLWLLVTPWTAAYQVPPSRDFLGKSTGVACHCLLRRSPGDTVNLQIQTQEVHVGGSPASLGRSQVLPPAGGGPRFRVYRRSSSFAQEHLWLFWGCSGSFSAFPAEEGRAAGLQLFPVLALIPLVPHYTAHRVDTDLYTQKAPQWVNEQMWWEPLWCC